MKELVIVPTWRRNDYLYCSLRRIREQDKKVPIFVFSDRGEDNPDLRRVCQEFSARVKIVPRHNYYGNSFCVLEALRWAFDQGASLVHFNEDDFMQSADCLAWHRDVHDRFDDIFCSCGWVFNRQAPISNDLMFAPWYYAPNACVRREKLSQVVQHANPLYYNSMREYVLETFPDSLLHAKGQQENTLFLEQDALFQYCIEVDKSQVAWNGIAKGSHCGASGYNRPTGPEFKGSLEERIAQVESLIADPWWRAELFSREVVEREIGRTLPKREFRYRIKLPNGWTSEFTSELAKQRLSRRINSVNLDENSMIELAQ